MTHRGEQEDVCAVLGISNSGNVTARLDDDEKDVHTVDTLEVIRNSPLT
jgi:prophage antirepressor-like protein